MGAACSCLCVAQDGNDPQPVVSRPPSAFVFALPPELLEHILVYVWTGANGVNGSGSLLESQIVCKTWYAVCRRVMNVHWAIEQRDDLRKVRNRVMRV